jgi:sulfite reductase (NADPH) flavoprotein alpha-component
VSALLAPMLPTVPTAIQLLPKDAPFSPEQQAWLNGFFAGLLKGLAEGAQAQNSGQAPRLAIKILFASQTGTAEGLAKKLTKEARRRGFNADLLDLGSLSLEVLATLAHVLVIASTHGDGDAPDCAARFAQQLQAAQGTPFTGLKYAVLALGDRSYSKFCSFGQHIDERFAELGAIRLAERIDADGDVDEPFKSFRETLWRTLPVESPASSAANSVAGALDASDEAPETNEPRWTRNRPFAAPLLGQKLLTGAGSDKETRHIVLSLKHADLYYEPGDALGVWPQQAPELVDAVLALSGAGADSPVTIDGEQIGLRDALSLKRELTTLTATTVIKYSAFASDSGLRFLVQREQSAALNQFLYGKDIVDLLKDYPGTILDAQWLVELLPPLKPRLYSISSSLAAFAEEVHLTIAAVRHECRGRRRGGLASTWFADRVAVGDTTAIYVHQNPRFRLPSDPGIPIIMIGPGTGIAPFRAFLHHRRKHGFTGRTWLFFGERHSECDFLYRSEFESFVAGHELSRIDTAFSRDQQQKIYVQHRMIEAGTEIWSWLQDGAVIYVCGDATHMAKDVDAALQAIIAKHGRRSAAQAQLEMHALAADGRYLRDVY